MDDRFNHEFEGEFIQEKKGLSLFFKVGIIVLSLLLVIGASVYFIPKTITVISSSGRKLPIYCVNTEEPKIALSFDAAWGEGQMWKI